MAAAATFMRIFLMISILLASVPAHAADAPQATKTPAPVAVPAAPAGGDSANKDSDIFPPERRKDQIELLPGLQHN